MDTAGIVRQCGTLPGVQVEQRAGYAELHLSHAEGTGRMRFLPVFPGITLALISVNASSWPAPELEGSRPEARGPLIINYCTRGRCELVLNNHKSVFLTTGHISLTEKFARNEYVYPGRIYEGIELFIDPEVAEQGLPLLKESFGVDIPALRERCCSGGDTYIAKMPLPDGLLERLTGQDLPEMPGITEGQKTAVIDLLAYLLSRPQAEPEPLVYFTRLQVEMAREIEREINRDLSVSHTVREFAQRFSVSESSIKKYFSGIYGQSISQYATHRRMDHAAELLADTGLPIIEVASQVGYESQSKFAAAFRKEFGVSPRDYRQGRRMHGMSRKE